MFLSVQRCPSVVSPARRCGIVDVLQVRSESRCHCADVLGKFENRSCTYEICFFFLAWCDDYSLLVGVILIPMHPMRMETVAGQHPIGLGAVQPETGGSSPVKSKNPSHRREPPLAQSSMPIEQCGLSPVGRVLLPVLNRHHERKLGCPLQGASLGRVIWRTSCCPGGKSPH